LTIFPREDLDVRNFYTFDYYIRSEDTSEQANELTVKIIELEDSFEIGAEELDPAESSMQIYIHNRERFNFEEVKVDFSSTFFDIHETFELGSNERKNFTIELNKDDFKKIMAGFYTLTAEISVEGQTAELQTSIKFIEKDIVTTTSKAYGLIVSTKVIKKENQGNVITQSETVIKKNILSRLFTGFSPDPDFVERQGATVYYTWNRQINPGEALEITVRTNWLFPLLHYSNCNFNEEIYKNNIIFKEKSNLR
jgi:hypothetical protein